MAQSKQTFSAASDCHALLIGVCQLNQRKTMGVNEQVLDRLPYRAAK